MDTNNEVRTNWAKQDPPFGAFDDYVLIATINQSHKFLIRPEEFDHLMNLQFDSWKTGKSKYTQVLKEWNESIGFDDIQEEPSKIIDFDNWIESLRIIEGNDQEEFGKICDTDIHRLIDFLMTHKTEEFLISKVWFK